MTTASSPKVGPHTSAHAFQARSFIVISMLVALGAEAQTPAGYISAYAPHGTVSREEVVEVTRNGETLSLRDLPRFVATGDRIRLIRKDGSITLAMGDGSSVVVKWSDQPYVVPGVEVRFDWTILFRPRPLPRRKAVEALTAKADFGPLLYPDFFEPFVVQYPMAYVGATLSMFPSVGRPTPEPVRIFKPWLPDKFVSSSGMWKAEEAEPMVLITGKNNYIRWMNGTGPFEFKLTMTDGVSVRIPAVSTTDTIAVQGASSVRIDGRWLTPGWATFYVKDTNSKMLSAHALAVDLTQLSRCPFVQGPFSALTLDAAVVCDAWREYGDQVSGPKPDSNKR